MRTPSAWLNGAEAAAAAGGSAPPNVGDNATTDIRNAPRQRLPARRGEGNGDNNENGGGEPPLPDFVWDPADIVGAYASLFVVLGIGATPWLADQRYGYIPYFASLAFIAIYLGAHRGLVREDRENFTLQQSAAAPFALSFSLFGIYLVIKYTNFDLAALVGGYFWLLGTLAVGSNLMLPLGTLGGGGGVGAETEKGVEERRRHMKWEDLVVWNAPVPEGLAVDRETGESVREVPVTAAAAAAGAVGVTAATADVLLGHGNHTLNNFLAVCIVADFLSLLGLGSFVAAGALLLGLLAYDAFWVFGSGYVFGRRDVYYSLFTHTHIHTLFFFVCFYNTTVL